MSTYSHTAISAGAAANAATINAPLGQLDAAIGSLATLTTTAKSTAVAAINELDTLIGTSPNLVFDPLNRYYEPVASGNQDGKPRWWRASTLPTLEVDAANPFGLRTFRMVDSAGKALYISEMGLKVGDIISGGILALVPVGVGAACGFTFRNAAGGAISLSAGSTVAGSGATVYLTQNAATIPALCVSIDLYVSYISGAGTVDVYGWYLSKGSESLPNMAVDGGSDGQRAMQQIFETFSQETTLTERLLRQSRALSQDPFARMYAPKASDDTLSDGGRRRFYGQSGITRTLGDTNNPFGTPTLTLATAAGRRFWLDEIGVEVGDTLSFAALIRSTVGNTYAISYAFRTSGGVSVTAGSGTATAADGNVQTLTKLAIVVPATAASVDVYFTRSVGAGTIDVYGIFVYPGSVISEEELYSLGYAQRYDAGGWMLKKIDQPAQVKSELLSWRNKQARIALAESGKYARILAIGDSITNGNYRWLKATLERLQVDAGGLTTGSNGIGFLSTNSAHWTYSGVGAMAKFTTISKTGSWTTHDDTTTPIGIGPDLSDIQSGAAADVVSITAQFTDARILYAKQVGGGTFKYRIDGGAWSGNIDTNAASAFGVVTITGQSSASHTLEVYANGANVKLLGFEMYDTGIAGYTGQKCGYSGARVSYWTAVTSNQIWQDAIAGFDPDLVTIWLGTNDRNQSVTDTTFKANMLTLISNLRTALPNVSILLVAPYIDGLGFVNKQTFESYRDRLAEITNEVTSCAMLDMGAYINYTLGNALTLFEDTTHINEYGGQIAGKAVYDLLKW